MSTKTKKPIKEFVSDDMQSTIPDPVAEPSNARPADQTGADTGPVTYDSNAAFMGGILNMIRALSPEQLSAVFSGLQSYMPGGGGDNAVAHGRPAATQNQATLNPGGGVVPQAPMPSLTHEALERLFATTGLSESFAEDAKIVFEAAVTEKVIMIEAELKDAADAALEEAKAALAEETAGDVTKLRQGLDSYLSLVVTKWLDENKIAIDSGLKAQIGESLIVGLKALAQDHNITIDEETVDVVEDLKVKVEENSTKYNDLANALVEANKVIEGYKRIEIIESVCAGMTMTQVERVKTLAETADYISEDKFRTRITVLKEQFIAEGDKPTKTNHAPTVVNEKTDTPTASKTGDSVMDRYVNAARNSVKYK